MMPATVPAMEPAPKPPPEPPPPEPAPPPRPTSEPAPVPSNIVCNICHKGTLAVHVITRLSPGVAAVGQLLMIMAGLSVILTILFAAVNASRSPIDSLFVSRPLIAEHTDLLLGSAISSFVAGLLMSMKRRVLRCDYCSAIAPME